MVFGGQRKEKAKCSKTSSPPDCMGLEAAWDLPLLGALLCKLEDQGKSFAEA